MLPSSVKQFRNLHLLYTLQFRNSSSVEIVGIHAIFQVFANARPV